MSKPSSGNVGRGSLNNSGQHHSPLQPNPTPLNAGGVGPKPMEPSSSIHEVCIICGCFFFLIKLHGSGLYNYLCSVGY